MVNPNPKHVAIIMDGNRRYGEKMFNDKLRGHQASVDKLVETIDAFKKDNNDIYSEYKIDIQTLYAFSIENWNRPQYEIDKLFQIADSMFDKIAEYAKSFKVRIKIICCDDSKIPPDLVTKMNLIQRQTKKNKRLLVNVCISYSGKSEIAYAMQQIVKKGLPVNEQTISDNLLIKQDADIIIRTSGEKRISNFLLWQLSYAELFFVDKLWPEITREDIDQVWNEYIHERKIRNGK
jgi:undecaprenyl diphosphate synthase